MDVIFNCPKCDQELAVDSSGAGTEIDCPSCGESLIIPAPGPGARLATTDDEDTPGAVIVSGPINAIAASAAARVERHLRVPVRTAPSERLIEKPLQPLDAAVKDTDKKLRVKTIKHTDCIEVGHDKFDEMVSAFLIKIGEASIVSITPLTYSHLDIASQKLITDFGVMIVFKG